MIQYLVMRAHAYTVRTFLRTWGEELGNRINVMAYEDIVGKAPRSFPRGTYVFSDLDRLHTDAREVFKGLYDQLSDRFGSEHVLNDPKNAQLRLQVLETLHRSGQNRFTAFRTDRTRLPQCYPVFIRPELGTNPGDPTLLDDETAYRIDLKSKLDTAMLPDTLVTIEFCDTRDAQGIYRKYGAFVVGQRIVPRHIFFSHHWMVKNADLDTPEFVAEERQYLQHNPHEIVLREAARQLSIGYGRIDYSLLDDQVQIWEVNTNPMIASRLSKALPSRRPNHLYFVEQFARALTEIDTYAREPI